MLGLRAPALRTFGPGSVSSLLNIALAVAFWLMIALTVLMVLGFIVLVFIPLGPLGLTVTDDAGGTQIPVPKAYALFGIGAFASYFGGFALILRHLRRIFRTLSLGDPFHPANVSRL
jgi:hypothetical protein